MANQQEHSFQSLVDGIDHELIVIQHEQTKYYNVTKARNLIIVKINKLRGTNYGVKYKEISKYFKNESSQRLITHLKTTYKLTNNIKFVLNSNIHKQYEGTYVHPIIFNHILMWIDEEYAVQVSKLIEDQRNFTNAQLLKEKESRIETLLLENKKILNATHTEIMANQSLIRNLNDNVDDLRDVVQERTEDININPDNTNHIPHYAAIYDKVDKSIKIIGGKKQYINGKIKSIYGDQEVLVNSTYNPNPIDFKVRLTEHIKSVYNNDLNQVKSTNYDSNEEKTKAVNTFKNDPSIKMCYNTIRFNTECYSKQDVLDIIISIADARYSLPIP